MELMGMVEQLVLSVFEAYACYIEIALAYNRAIDPLRPKSVTVKSTCPPTQRSVRGGRRK